MRDNLARSPKGAHMKLSIDRDGYRAHPPRIVILSLLLSSLCAAQVSRPVAEAPADPDVASMQPAAPPPVDGFEARFGGGFEIELRWDAVDASANGIVVERCRPQEAPSGCELAAALHPDARALRYHAIQPWQFRVATFNEQGVSPFSPLSQVVGEEHVVDIADAAPLQASDSILARRIVPSTDEAWRCTSPQALIDDGLTLVAVRADVDLYRGPAGECGTGGCPYASFTVTDGCYHVLENGLGLYSQAPFSGKPGHRDGELRLANSSGRACEGRMTVFQADVQVDAYDWFGCYDEHLPNLRAPFNPHGLQRPDVPR